VDSTATIPPVAPAAVLTREDSLAIARAIQKKIGEQQAAVAAKAESVQKKPPTSAGATAKAAEDFTRSMARVVDSLRAEIQKAVLDSVTRVRGTPGFTFLTGDARIDSMVRRLSRDGERGSGRRPEITMFPEPPQPRSVTLSREAFAERAANLGPPRRLFVSFPTLSSRNRFLAPQVDSLVDSLRATLARDPRYVLVPADSVREMLATTRTTSRIADSMHVDLFASVGASVLPDTSVIWQLTSRDLGAHSSYAMRAITMRRERPDLLKGIDSLVTETARLLREQDRAPRRQPNRDGRPQ